jgi:hypothetical protein
MFAEKVIVFKVWFGPEDSRLIAKVYVDGAKAEDQIIL